MKQLRVAILHYWFVTWRGGEKVVESILKLFPQADIYTLFYDPDVCGPHLKGHTIYTSSINKPFLRKRHQKVFPLYPLGVKSIKLQKEYDLIISSESGPIKGVEIPKGTPHLCYTHTPMRYCWGYTEDYLKAIAPWQRGVAAWAFERLRQYDETTISNVTHYVANSQNVRNRIQRYYHRDSSVVYPPIALDLFQDENLVQNTIAERSYYLSFGALTPYKNVDLLVEWSNKTHQKLVVIGSGSELEKLKAKAGDSVEILGQQKWSVIREKILGAKALLFPGEEDFGMIPLEVMAHGVPVIALGKGGALETVVENSENLSHSSGMLFSEPTLDSLQNAIDRFESVQDQFNPLWIRNHARSFGEDHFQQKILDKIKNLLDRR